MYHSSCWAFILDLLEVYVAGRNTVYVYGEPQPGRFYIQVYNAE